MRRKNYVILFLLLVLSIMLTSCNHKHEWREWTVTTEAKCTEKGEEKRMCACGEEETREIAAVGHKFGEWTVTTEAKCTEKGEEKRVCACGEEDTREIAATGHNLKEATCTAPMTCQNGCGYTVGNELGHINNKGVCDRCGEKISIDMKTVVGHPDECKTTSFFGFCYYKNSADGIKVCWGGENLSGKTINYYTITIYFMNAVGDPAYSEITGKSSKTIRYVGPVEPNKDMIIFGIVDYVPTCSKIIIGEITLEYSDGTVDTGWYGYSTTYRNSNIK